MRIDAHQHFWRYNADEFDWIDDSMSALRRDFGPADLKVEFDRTGFQGSIAVQARQSLEETRWLLDLAAPSPLILGVVGWFDLRSPDLRSQLREFAGNPKLVGVRHVVQGEPDDRFLLRPDFLRGIGALEEFDLAYDILIYPRHLPVAAEFVQQFPRQRFVLDHLAKPLIKSGSIHPLEEGMRELAKFPNVYCKLSGMVTEADWAAWTPGDFRPYFDVAYEAFGPKRVLYGSDYPVCTVAASYGQVKALLADYVASFTESERADLFGGNAQRWYRIDHETLARSQSRTASLRR